MSALGSTEVPKLLSRALGRQALLTGQPPGGSGPVAAMHLAGPRGLRSASRHRAAPRGCRGPAAWHQRPPDTRTARRWCGSFFSPGRFFQIRNRYVQGNPYLGCLQDDQPSERWLCILLKRRLSKTHP